MSRNHSHGRQRILLLRPDNIGDFVLFSGALKHIRNLYPHAHVTLAVQTHILALVALCPYVDRCVSFDELSWYQRLKYRDMPLLRFFDPLFQKIVRVLECKFKRFDLIIYPVKSPQVAHLEMINLLGAKEVVGIVGCDLNVLKAHRPSKLRATELYDRSLDVSSRDPWRHELMTTFDFLKVLGCQLHSAEAIMPELWLAESDKDHLEGFRRPGRKVVGLFPGASSPKRQWATANFSRLAVLLGTKVDFVIFGSSSDMVLASDVEQQLSEVSGANTLNLAGKTSLRELAKTIQSCDLFIGMETSGLHMAIAGGVKTIGLVGGGHYDRFVPWGDPDRHKFLTRKMDCFHCDWTCIYDRIECIQSVSPDEVAATAIGLLGEACDNYVASR